MTHSAWLVPLTLTLAFSPFAPGALAADTPAAKPSDVESIDTIVAAMYDVISGPKGEARDWDRLRSLCAPGARLIPVRSRPSEPAQARVLDLEQFIAIVDPATREDGFFESEIARKTEQFGHIAHVFSTYESRKAKGDAPFARGINSIQLLNDGKRWWILTIYWDQESPSQPLPEAYLPPAK